MQMKYVNVSGYQFFTIEKERLEPLRDALKTHCREMGLKGSILLAEEGLNGFLSGTVEQIDQIIEELSTKFGLPEIAFKRSPSDHQPFKRMLVKIKKEIVSMGQPQIKPAEMPAPYVDAKTFQQWLDDGEEIIILDTRNDYEIELGKFEGAMDLDIDHFRAFPEAIKEIKHLKDKKIVTYCTGGIRCEKAAPLMVEEGFTNVFQLDGGILKYFEEVGPQHYEGECFVFDKRVAVDASLNETGTTQCYACRMPVTQDIFESPEYVPGKHCPACIERYQAQQTQTTDSDTAQL